MTALREVTDELFQDVNCSTCKLTNLAKQLLEKYITLCKSVLVSLHLILNANIYSAFNISSDISGNLWRPNKKRKLHDLYAIQNTCLCILSMIARKN